MVSFGRPGLLLFVSVVLIVLVSSELIVALKAWLDLGSLLSGFLHALSGSIRISTSHELLEGLLISSSLHLVNVLSHSLLLEDINILESLLRLGSIGVETAFFGGLLELIIDGALVISLSRALSHQIKIGVNVASGRSSMNSNIVSLGSQSKLLSYLLLLLKLDLIESMLSPLLVLRTK